MDTKSTEKEQLFLLETLYKEHLPRLLQYARRYVPDAVADDLVQDVFFRLWQGNRTFFDIADDGIQQMYLYRSVRNACKDWLKHKIAVSNHISETLYLSRFETMDEEAVEPELFEERLKNVQREAEKLPERCREIFFMRYRKMLKSRDIARYFGISQRTVEAQLYKALQLLRKTLK